MKSLSQVWKALFVITLMITFLMGPMIWTSSSLAAEKPITLKLACQNLGATETVLMTDKYFKKLVEDRSEGKIQIELYPDTLAKGPAAFPAVQEGIADMASIVSTFISGLVKDVGVFELLGVYPTNRFPEVAELIRPVLTKVFEKQDLKHLASFYSNSGAIYLSKKRHYQSLEDVRGQKIRLPGVWNNKMLKLWGAAPAMILPAEIYTSLQRGIVDGVGTIMPLVVLLKLYEPGPYVTEHQNTSTCINFLLMNMDKFKSLDQKYQDILVQAGKEAVIYSFEYGVTLEEKQRDILKAEANYLMVGRQQIAPFLEKAESLYPEIRSYCGPLGNQLLDILKSMD